MIVTIGGYKGTETRELSKLLALETGMKYIGEEEIEKRISGESEEERSEKRKEEIMREGEKEETIIEHVLSGLMLENAEAKVFLLSGKKMRARRISEKEGVEMDQAIERIEAMDKEIRDDYLKYYGVNLLDLKDYDLVLNVDKLDRESAVKIIKKYIEKIKK
ncbi:MAG: cytidylate kinase family protein [archaeon]